MRYCRRILGDRESAEDAVQQVFLAAYRSLISSDREIHLAPWLFTIARNTSFSFAQRPREHPLSDGQAAPDELAELVQYRLALTQLIHDLEQLPQDQRAALTLTASGFSHAATAASLDVRREKVKSLVFQARKALEAIAAAREIACATIRDELTTMHGADLRRAHLRRHLHECESCRDYAYRRLATRRRPRQRVTQPARGPVGAPAPAAHVERSER